MRLLLYINYGVRYDSAVWKPYPGIGMEYALGNGSRCLEDDSKIK
jgi:hypothetical protein